MNNEASSLPENPVHPIEIIRQVFNEAGWNFDDDDTFLTLRLWLQRVEVRILARAERDDMAILVVILPIRAEKRSRARVGEFLHRLNYASKRKFWEMDYEDGELRLSAYTDLISAPLTADLYRSMLHVLTTHADEAFPYLTSVIAGRMKPDFAADQALAAFEATRKKTEPDADAEEDN